MVVYRNKMSQMLTLRVKPWVSNIGDLVLKRTAIACSNAGSGKLHKNWEGPFRFSKVIRPKTYKLAKLDGRVIPIPEIFVIYKNFINNFNEIFFDMLCFIQLYRTIVFQNKHELKIKEHSHRKKPQSGNRQAIIRVLVPIKKLNMHLCLSHKVSSHQATV